MVLTILHGQALDQIIHADPSNFTTISFLSLETLWKIQVFLKQLQKDELEQRSQSLLFIN